MLSSFRISPVPDRDALDGEVHEVPRLGVEGKTDYPYRTGLCLERLDIAFFADTFHASIMALSLALPNYSCLYCTIMLPQTAIAHSRFHVA